MSFSSRFVLLFSFLFAAHAAKAEPLGGVISEVRAGVMRHDVGYLGNGKESGTDLNAEVLFVPLRLAREGGGFVGSLLSPRPHLGVQVNTAGDASQIYAGLTWTFSMLDFAWLGLGAGGTLHDGELNERANAAEKALGSRVLFRLSAEIGYDLTENFSVSMYYDHESNAGLSEHNEGLNNWGVRVGWRF